MKTIIHHTHRKTLAVAFAVSVTAGFCMNTNAQTILSGDFSHVDTSGGPVALSEVQIPGTTPQLEWIASSPYEVLSNAATGGNAARAENGISFIQDTDGNGVAIEQFSLSIDLLYFDTTSNGGARTGSISYFTDDRSDVVNTTTSSSNRGFGIEYGFRQPTSSEFELELFYNEGNPTKDLISLATATVSPGVIQRDGTSNNVSGDPVNLLLQVENGVHSVYIEGELAFSYDSAGSGYVESGVLGTINSVSNRETGFTNVELTGIPEPGIAGFIAGTMVLGIALITRRR